ncbi:DUF3263 domain-containing protein [Actinoplanes sp. NPDC026623]|uniref:DUF3263 domain-containing protein n=1 Tax=Actinoplanes sp. NPDC026623 TaxID=3155610 RepID=UPI003406B827
MGGCHYAGDPLRTSVRALPPPRSAMQPDAELNQQVPAPREADADETTPAPALSDREVQILAFESKWWKHAGSKEQAIRDAFGLSSTRYYQLLNALLDNPAALEHDPVLIGRLRRLRSTRARTRRR